MKVILAVPGHLKTVPMSGFADAALRDLGHEVRVVDYHAGAFDKAVALGRRAIGDDEIAAGVNRRVRRAIESFRPDLLFTIYGFNLSAQTLEFARSRGVVRACWWINDPFQFDRGLKLAPGYDVWFSNSSVCAEWIREQVGIPAHFLPVAVDPRIHRPVAPDPASSCDLCFAGDWSAAREALAIRLLDAGIGLRVFGPWERKIAEDSPLRRNLVPGFFGPEQMVRYFCSARLVLNFHTWHGRFDHGVNPRLFEAAACGVAQIVDDKREIASLFAPEREVLVYRSLDELPGLARAALGDDGRLAAVGDAGRRRAHAEHTYEVRMRQMLALLP